MNFSDTLRRLIIRASVHVEKSPTAVRMEPSSRTTSPAGPAQLPTEASAAAMVLSDMTMEMGDVPASPSRLCAPKEAYQAATRSFFASI